MSTCMKVRKGSKRNELMSVCIFVFDKTILFIVALLTDVAEESVYTSVFRKVVLLSHLFLEHFPTIFARIAFTFMTPHVFIEVV